MLRNVIYSYNDAERADESRSIVPAYTALDTLAWSILVISEGWLTGGRNGGYERLDGADRLRLLLKWSDLSTSVPESLLFASRKSIAEQCDGPQIVSWVRNRTVHPDKKDQLTTEIATEASVLAMSYIDLIALNLLEYDGYYRDRLAHTSRSDYIKRVPWADSHS